MALIINLPIFVENCGHFLCYHGNGGLAEKSPIYFVLRPILLFWITIALTMQIKKNPIYLQCLTISNFRKQLCCFVLDISGEQSNEPVQLRDINSDSGGYQRPSSRNTVVIIQRHCP